MPKHKPEWKERRARAVQDRMEYVRKEIASMGGSILEESDTYVKFRRGVIIITYYPFTGGYTGKGIESGRGILNLKKYLTDPSSRKKTNS